ncbi:MAG: hypothetical protein SFZ23_04370 [Planctomycetota bacterium]|nr:hypothetical protein [Planctomycetota bacterium]
MRSERFRVDGVGAGRIGSAGRLRIALAAMVLMTAACAAIERPEAALEQQTTAARWSEFRRVKTEQSASANSIITVSGPVPKHVKAYANGNLAFEAMVGRSNACDGVALIGAMSGEPELTLHAGSARTWSGRPRLATRRLQGTVPALVQGQTGSGVAVASVGNTDSAAESASGTPNLLFMVANIASTPSGEDKVTYRAFLLQDDRGGVVTAKLEFADKLKPGATYKHELKEPSYLEWVESGDGVEFKAIVVAKDYPQAVRAETEAILKATVDEGAPGAKLGS